MARSDCGGAYAFPWRTVLRAIITGLIAIASFFLAPAAMAAPVCLGTGRCGLHAGGVSLSDPLTLLAIAIFAGLMAMVALLPDFDGTSDEDWGGANGDDLWRH